MPLENRLSALEGSYYCKGTMLDLSNEAYPTHIQDYLDERYRPKKTCNVFKIQSTDARGVEIQLLSSGEVVSTISLDDESEYTWKEGWLVLPRTRDVIAQEGVAGYSTQESLLGKDVQGALVLKSNESITGTMLLIPIAGSGHMWVKFRPSE